MISVTKRFTFEACHFLPNYVGACHQLHGHSYKMFVTVAGKIIADDNNPKKGMILDFKDLKRIVNEEIIEKVDHKNLNDIFENPTAESMVVCFANRLMLRLPDDLKLVKLQLWETEDSYAEWSYIKNVD